MPVTRSNAIETHSAAVSSWIITASLYYVILLARASHLRFM